MASTIDFIKNKPVQIDNFFKMSASNFILDKSDWMKVQLGNIAYEINDRVDNPAESSFDRFVGLEHFVSGDLKIKSWAITDNLTSSCKAFQAGDVLFARRNTYLRRASLVEFDGICSGDAFVLRENHDIVVPGFLTFVVNSNKLWDFANANAAGTMSKRIKWRDLLRYEFLLPPKEQQAKLSELLWAGDESLGAIMKLGNVFSKAKEDISEILIYRGGNESFAVKQTPIGEIPEHWDCQKIDEALDIVSGMVDPKKEPYLSMIQIGPEHVEPSTGVILEKKTARELNLESGKYVFDESHVIYSKIRPYLKKVTLPNFSGLCSADMYALRAKDNQIDKRYLKSFLLSRRFTKQALKFQNRTGMPKINRQELGSISIPIPPMTEQKKVVFTLDSLESTQVAISQSKLSAKTLLQALVNQIFP